MHRAEHARERELDVKSIAYREQANSSSARHTATTADAVEEPNERTCTKIQEKKTTQKQMPKEVFDE